MEQISPVLDIGTAKIINQIGQIKFTGGTATSRQVNPNRDDPVHMLDTGRQRERERVDAAGERLVDVDAVE
jgi:hypothetical protein